MMLYTVGGAFLFLASMENEEMYLCRSIARRYSPGRVLSWNLYQES